VSEALASACIEAHVRLRPRSFAATWIACILPQGLTWRESRFLLTSLDDSSSDLLEKINGDFQVD
jgi:hypothetical protein